MNNIKIIENCITILGILIDIFIILKIIIEKRRILKSEKNTAIKNDIYIALITINMILFLIFGFLRNFE